MDTSETYINMCREAKEIQDGWVRGNGDFYYRDPEDDVYVVDCLVSSEDIERGKYLWRRFWLPRQDQLQEMLGLDNHSLMMKFCRFYNFNLGYNSADHNIIFINCQSMEILWLLFVMEEKYNKQWDGDKWIEKNL